ncbi:Acyl-CoA-binding domain-containing protein 1 [Mortierella hygrophila]|uniref:Acyl-CoA-binding domain-containing protein 1 n=1 Tax=Mortierella hygrophila TaxID=979708 RepID=A0A9P6F5F7_9FUNG|nr:Acyl-CoA-binding domain-containing protein 1 [Mortierella hygrophila]
MPSAEFDAAAAKIKELTTSPSNDNLLELYALFKQATVGDNNTERPGTFDFKGKAKWDAWTKKQGISKEEAEKEYIKLVAELTKDA